MNGHATPAFKTLFFVLFCFLLSSAHAHQWARKHKTGKVEFANVLLCSGPPRPKLTFSSKH
jgi:hypothetical protein